MANQNLDFNKLLPQYLKNETLASLVSNLFNRFVSNEKSVFIAGNIGTQVAGQATIVEPNLERQQNALIPGLYFVAGTEKYLFTFDDLINKIKTLDIDLNDLRTWISEQTFNYTPPVDFDKFINYNNYYWVGSSLTTGSGPAWNPNNNAEYYVIERPPVDGPVKMPVKLATTAAMSNINLYRNNRPTETFTLTFSSSTTFSITSNIDANIITGPFTLASTVPGVKTPVTISTQDNGTTSPSLFHGVQVVELLNFSITNGASSFSAGDEFTIAISYFTGNIVAILNAINPIGKGVISGLISPCPAMWIDGIEINVGDRILVLHQTNTAENGIYIVTHDGQFTRASDLADGASVSSAIVYVTNGLTNIGKTWDFTHTPAVVVSVAPLVFIMNPANPPLAINAWQIGNYWIHKDDIATSNSLGFPITTWAQAQRPIIEYPNTLKINSHVDGNGNPADGPIIQFQSKTRFNQIPQFDLYYYDGTHAGLTSGIWYYEEGPNYVTDNILLRRVVKTVNADYVFGAGVKDTEGRALYWKNSGKLESIWMPGSPYMKASTPVFTGAVNKGSITIPLVTNVCDNQQWTITAISPTTFSVVGSRSGNVGTATVGTLFISDEIHIEIMAGVNPFAVGEIFKFNTTGPVAPRYIEELSDGNIINYPGGYAADQATANPSGAWLTPARMFQNLYRETQTSIAYGDFLNHGMSVLAWQDQFKGSPFGDNNARNIAFNPGLGGQIREFGSNFPLLASMLIEQDLSPITIIDFAEQQYNIALSSIDQFLINNLADYLSNVSSIETTTINPNAADIQALEAYFETLRGENTLLTQVFSDTTAKVTNWPATLPMLGLMPRVLPNIIFDYELSTLSILHHDGHTSSIASNNPDFDRTLVRTIVTRSDGTKSPGTFSEIMPASPYARQLWMQPSTFMMKLFNVTYDTATTPPNGVVGQYWFNRTTDTLRQWDPAGKTWVLSGTSIASLWVPIDASAIRNSMVLAVENKLYNSVHPQQQINLQLLAPAVVNSPYSQLELAQFSAEYNYDMFAADYVPSNPFSWNYKQAMVPRLTHSPARWYDVYKEYFSTFTGTLPTDRPDIEPWKLLGFATEPATWQAQYAAPQYTISSTTTALWVATTNITLAGLQMIDGVNTIAAFDRVLVTGQTLPQFNGIYIANTGGWLRALDVLANGLAVTIDSDYVWAGSTWVITTSDPIITGTTAVAFNQQRVWLRQMWTDIKASQTDMQLCVNVNTDTLLPPYVSSSVYSYTEALINIIPNGINLGYAFGDNGPVELVWKKSLEYIYGLARSYFRLYPLQFLDASWGETYLQTPNNLRVERNTMTSLPDSKFLMHGERLNLINAYTPAQVQARFANPNITWSQTFAGTVSFVVTHTANTGAVGPLGAMGPSSTVFTVYVNGTNIGLIYEGVPFSFSSQGVTYTAVTIKDLGIPYEMGDTLTMTFQADTIIETIPTTGTDFVYGTLGCEGCVADATLDPKTVVTDIRYQPTYSHTLAQTKIFNGLGQWFTDLLRYTYIDTSISPASLAYRGWSVNLVHRLASLIRPDSLEIDTSHGNMPDTAYNVVLKRATNTADLWISGLRVQLVRPGNSVVNSLSNSTPVGDGSDWLFRVEGYNAANPQTNYYILQTSPDPISGAPAPYQDFYALSKAHTDIAWKRYTTSIATANTTLPLQITGIQNVLNFIVGYVAYLQNEGFKINADETPVTDAQTGRNLDWQLEIEKYIDTVYAGMGVGQAYILNPFMNALHLQTPIGLMGRYTTSAFIDVASTQACYDVLGNAIPVRELSVIRTDEQTVTYTQTPIFSAHVFIDQFEHAIVFNDTWSSDPTSTQVFNPFLGEYLSTAYLTFTRQDSTDGKPTFDGFVLNGDNIIRNVVSSVETISNVYDSDKTFNDPQTAQHATALLGFQTKSYFDDININDQTQLNFWQGMIHAKGTNLAIDAFTNYSAFSQANIDEYWAYKLATYGDARERTFPEIKINPSDCAQNFTQLQFYSSSDTTYSALPLYIQIESNDDTRWFTVDDLGTTLRFDSNAISEEVTVASASVSNPTYAALQNIYHNGDGFAPTVSGPSGASVITANMLKVTQPGTYTVSGYTWLNPTKFSPVKLFDYSNKVLDEQIALWHPAIGIHANSGLEAVNMITANDPASYNYSTNTTDNPNYLAIKPWADREVGRTWWDTSNLAYVSYYDATIYPDRQSRQTRWGALADWASIDLYVWTESDYSPADYNAIAASQAGDSTIDPSVRLSGTVGFTNNYSAERIISIAPIAWSQAGIGNGNAHPAFGPAYFTKIYLTGGNIIADTGRLSAIGIQTGRSLGAWDMINNLPLSEILIDPSGGYDIGSSLNGPSAPVYAPVNPGNGQTLTFTVGPISNTSIFGSRIGQIQLLANELTPAVIAVTGVQGVAAVPYSWSFSTLVGGNGHTVGTQLNTPLTGGSGTGATASIVVDSSGAVVSAVITNFGNGYAVGDVLSSSLTGSGFALPIDSVTAAVAAVPSVTAVQAAPAVYSLRMMDSTGFYEDVLVDDWLSTDLSANSTFTYAFEKFGIQINAIRLATGTFTSKDQITALTGPANDIFMREYTAYVDLVPMPAGATALSNNPSDGYEYGWKTWIIPSQADLNTDMTPPNNQWLPYVGKSVIVPAMTATVAAMSGLDDTWTLPSGITINRYSSVWSSWTQLIDTIRVLVSNGTTKLSFTLTNEITLDSHRLSVYANGIQMNPSGYAISDNTVNVVNTLPEGTTVRLLYRAYQPTAANLAFNPLIADNPMVQTWYKQDYQYTHLVSRNSAGAVVGTKYYFWVTGKTDPLPNQSMSLVQAAKVLETGESNYMIFSRMVADSNSSSGAGYDSCAITGLGYQVTKTDSFKLRFLRDFTLRNDPEQLKLKNVHTEWTLIRQNQSTNIPTQLWSALTDAACGQGIGSNTLPSQRRVDYDNKYGTQTQFGFEQGQIFAPTSLVLASIINTVLNTSITITIGNNVIIDYITVLGITSSTTSESLTALWFSNPTQIRSTMNLIYSSARAPQVNEIFFNALNDALANNYEMTDLFKTSMLTVNSATIVQQQAQAEVISDFY